MKILKVTQEDCKGCKDLDFMLSNMGLEVDEVINLSTCEENKKTYVLEELKVMSTPQLFLLDDEGQVVDNVVGANQIPKVMMMFEKAEG